MCPRPSATVAQLGGLDGAAADVDGAQQGDHGAHALTLTPGTDVVCGKGSSEVTERTPSGKQPVPTVGGAPAPSPTEHPMNQHLVVVGGGMVAQRLVEALRDRDTAGTWRITVLAEEPRRPYDRVALTSYFSGRDADDLALGDPELWSDPLVTLVRDDAVTHIDRDAKTVTTAHGRTEHYDHLVLATGSSAWVPPIEGADLPGVFVYRTVDDVAELRGYVEKLSEDRVVKGAVLGGGLLGLEAAGALQALGAPHDRPAGGHAPHVDAGRPRRRRGAAAAHQPARRRRPAQRDDHEDPPAPARRRGSAGPGRRRPGRRGRRRDRRGRPAARRAGPRVGPGDRRARRHRRRRHLPDQRPRHLGRRRGRLHPGRHDRARRPRLRDGGDHRRPAARRHLDVPRRGHGDQAQALRRRRRQLRRRVRRDARRPRDRLGRPGGRRLQEARHVRRRAHAARRRPRRRRQRVRRACARCSAASCPATRPRSCCPRAAGERRSWSCPTTPPSARATTSRPAPSAARSPTTSAPTSARSRRAPRPAPAAARASRWSRSWSPPSWPQQGIDGQHRAVRALRPVPRAALRRRPGQRRLVVHAGHRAVRHPSRRARLRHLPADRRVDPGDDVPGARPRGRAGHAAGHQRPRHGQPAEGRLVLGGPAHRRRRGDARGAHRDRRGGQGLRAVHQDHRRPADRHVRRPHRPAARSSGSAWSTPGSSPATRTASRCAP